MSGMGCSHVLMHVMQSATLANELFCNGTAVSKLQAVLVSVAVVRVNELTLIVSIICKE